MWRAHDTATGRVVAVKVLPSRLAEDEVFQERFRREAYAAAALNEPHVILIHNSGDIEGRLYVDMRLAEGRDPAYFGPARAGSIRCARTPSTYMRQSCRRTAQPRSPTPSATPRPRRAPQQRHPRADLQPHSVTACRPSRSIIAAVWRSAIARTAMRFCMIGGVTAHRMPCTL